MAQDELFATLITHHEIPQDPRLSQLIWWAKRLAELGFTPSYGAGDHGNLSCRTEAGLLITARGTGKASLTAEQCVELLGVDRTPSGLQIRCRGIRLPSTDTLLHLRLYQRRPDIQAILHGHDDLTLAKAPQLKLPVTTQSAAVASLGLIEEVCALASRHDYVLLRDHGFVAVGRSVDEAGELVRRVCAQARSL